MANCLHTTTKSDKFNLQMRTGKNVINGRWAYINPYTNISRYNTGPNTYQIQFNIYLFRNTIQTAVTQQYMLELAVQAL